MARQTLISGERQLVTSGNRLRSLFTKCDSNFAELYNTVLLSVPIPAHASKTVYNLFAADQAYIVQSIRYTPDVAQGAALTACVVKAVGTATPAVGTTPMQSSTTGINCNGTAHTVQSITLTSTAADLALASGNRIGLVLSGALSTGSGVVTIRMRLT